MALPFHLIEGDGAPALVLVHAAMCDHSNWDRLTPYLTDRHRVLRLDMRGHGRSEAPLDQCHIAGWAGDINSLVEQSGLGPAILVGHSLGCRVVAQAAAQQPDATAAVILIDGSRIGPPTRETDTMAPGNGSLARARTSFDSMIGPFADEAVRRDVRQSMSPISRAVFAANGARIADWDVNRAEAVFSSLPADLPLLAIQSTFHDRDTPRYSLRSHEESTPFTGFLRRTVPHAEIAILPDAGHFNMMEKPAEVAALMSDFIGRLPVD